MNHEDYSKQVLSEHLFTNSYKQLSLYERQDRMLQTKQQLLKASHFHENLLGQAEKKSSLEASKTDSTPLSLWDV
jgi:hypothetical protein